LVRLLFFGVCSKSQLDKVVSFVTLFFVVPPASRPGQIRVIEACGYYRLRLIDNTEEHADGLRV